MAKSKFGVLKDRAIERSAASRRGEGTAAAAAAVVGKTSLRDNPEYSQFSAYLPKSLYQDVKRKLVGTELTLSEACEQALRAWLRASK